MGEPEVRRARCGELAVVWVEPTIRSARPSLALWLTHLGGSKEQTIPVLAELAAAGHVAVSFDPWRHGERGTGEAPRELLAAVLGDFRRQMWPVLGQTTLDCLRVIDWARAEIAPGSSVVAGGVSMGGDVSVALAGIEPRVGRVAAVVATPDWTRPGMRDITDPEAVTDQGSPDAGERVRVTVHPGAGHLDAVNDSVLVRHALDWLTVTSAATMTPRPDTQPSSPAGSPFGGEHDRLG